MIRNYGKESHPSIIKNTFKGSYFQIYFQQPRTGTSQPVPPGPSSIENDAHGIEKLLLKHK